MALKLSANLSFLFQETASLLERYALASAAGFRGVECADPYVHSVQDVVQAKTKHNLTQVLINVPVGNKEAGDVGLASVPNREAEFMDSMRQAIAYAKALDCQLIHIMSGKVTTESVDRHQDTLIRNLLQAVPLLSASGITGVIEPINKYSVPGYFMNSYDRALDVINRINSPNLKLQLDIFHLQLIQGDLTHSISSLLPHVAHIQIAQAPFRHEPNSRGEINYRYIFELLREQKYDGWIGLEYKPASTTQEGLTWLKDFNLTL